MKVLIIGANGFLGRNLLIRTLALGWESDCVDISPDDSLPSNCKQFNVRVLDTLLEEYKFVFLFASHIPYDNMSGIKEELIKTNLELPVKIIKKFKNAKIIFSSSVSVYGNPEKVLNEHSVFNNPNFYGLSKLAGEFIVKTHAKYAIIRFPSLYGPGMNNFTFIPKLLLSAIETKKIRLFGTGNRLQNYLFIDDAVEYCIKAALFEGSDVFLGTYQKSYSNNEIAEIIRQIIPESEIVHEGKDYSSSYIYDNTYTKSKLNFSPLIRAEDGIKKIIVNE